MEQRRKGRNKSTQIGTIDFWHRSTSNSIENSLFNEWWWDIGYPYAKKLNFDQSLRSYTKIKSKQIIDLKVKCKTIKLLEENRGENLCILGLGQFFCREHIKNHEA